LYGKPASLLGAGGRDFSVVEPLVLAILLLIIVFGTAVLLSSIDISWAESRWVVTMNYAIQTNNNSQAN
jgi:hypothetical protein